MTISKYALLRIMFLIFLCFYYSRSLDITNCLIHSLPHKYLFSKYAPNIMNYTFQNIHVLSHIFL